MIVDINNGLFEIIEKLFLPQKKCRSSSLYRTHRCNRYIQVPTPIDDELVHYEFYLDPSINGTGYISLHFENVEDIDTIEKYNGLIQYLMEKTEGMTDYSWEPESWRESCTLTEPVDSEESLSKNFVDFVDYFDSLINQYLSKVPRKGELKFIEIDDKFTNQEDKVALYNETLRGIMSLPLHIPDYQRIYCWHDSNVELLLNDIFDHIINTEGRHTYCLGSIILHHLKEKGCYDIIDGQQRLVTLSLLLLELGVGTQLVNQKFDIKESEKYIAYNRYVIQRFLKKKTLFNRQNVVDKILDSVQFSVLALQDTSLDLAYTFFSNQNSRGVPLTDYDLLKAYHLRYIPGSLPKQAMTSAQMWNRMIEDGREAASENKSPDYVRTLDTCIYRMRQWIRKHECEDDKTPQRIKHEYEAAPIVEEIPPFGEKFYFNEPIQGGTHFFSFVEIHLRKYKQLKETEEYKTLHYYMKGGSNEWYADIIEAVLYAYSLKFNMLYLTEALSVIMRIVLQQRYTNEKAHKKAIISYANDSELILMLDRATSSTFFLGEALLKAKELEMPRYTQMKPIMLHMHQIAMKINYELKDKISISSFKKLNL